MLSFVFLLADHGCLTSIQAAIDAVSRIAALYELGCC